MKMEYVAGIDVGTSGCKTVIVDALGVVCSSQSKEYFHKNSPGLIDMDPMDWWNAAIETLKAACEKAGITPSQIGGIGCSGQMQGCTFIGTDGKPVRNSMLWFDMAPKDETAKLAKEYNDIFVRNCTMAPTTALTVSKIKWTMAHEHDTWVKTRKILFASGFVTYMLTGCLFADRSNIGFSGLNSVVENGWSKEILEITGITEDKLPDLLDCDEIAGRVTKTAAAHTGLLEGTPVIAGCGDATGECFSVNIENRPELKLRLGSACSADVVVPREWFGTKVTTVLPYNKVSFSSGGYTKGCALSIKWIRDVFFNELPKEDSSYNKMDNEAANTQLGSNGIIFHPYLNGENHPYFDTELRAKFTGIGLSAKRGDFVKAAYEGISFSILDMLESMPALNQMETLILCGGGTKSNIWLSVLVDVLGKNGVIPKSADASYGAALMAGQAAGLFNAAAAANKSRTDGTRVNFNPENHRAYSTIYKRYREIVRV